MKADASTESDDLVRNRCLSNFGQTVDFFAASSYGAATVASGDVSVNMAAAKIDVAGRHVLVVSRQRSARHPSRA
jgi:hypoxanthine-guanine phosphoribosyltransferase